MELNEKEFIDLSAYSVDRRRQILPSFSFDNSTYCIVYRTLYGSFIYHSYNAEDSYDMLRALKNADYKERKAVNNLGEM